MIDAALRVAAEESASARGAHVVDLILRGDPSRRVLEVFIDSEAGVTADLCSEVSRDLSGAIQHRGLIHGSYRLDVSSPGIDRPLTFSWQFRKHVGRRLHVRRRGGESPAEATGILREVDDTGITIEDEKTGERFVFPFGEIDRATVVAPW